jgi:hypothetical protein
MAKEESPLDLYIRGVCMSYEDDMQVGCSDVVTLRLKQLNT